MKSTQLIDQFQRARNDNSVVVVEGVQALKHALRFKANMQTIITSDLKQLRTFLTELAPDVCEQAINLATEVDDVVFQKLSPQPPRTGVIAIGQRAKYNLDSLDTKKPIVLLEDPRDLENIGAVIRVSAAADVAAVCITGPADIWHPAVIRGAAGLHFAVPVLNVKFEQIKKLNREIISLDPEGEELTKASFPANSILTFGTERHGISKSTLDASDQIIRLPMKPGVSSLNLATSVAATLYSRIP